MLTNGIGAAKIHPLKAGSKRKLLTVKQNIKKIVSFARSIFLPTGIL